MDENLKMVLDELRKLKEKQLEEEVDDHDCKEEECEVCLKIKGEQHED
jgi:hypothetical protein